jgi:hypothetical protein
MDRAYSVEGIWPFPLDMLRHDQARAATPKDQDIINRMVGDVSDHDLGMSKVKIDLVMEGGEPLPGRPKGRWRPNIERWESFGWKVSGDAEIDLHRAHRESMRIDNELKRSALSKLNGDERRALGL